MPIPRVVSPRELSDDELDRYVLVRLSMAGVDLSVLPLNDPGAPVDQLRVLRSARDFLRYELHGVSQYALDPLDGPPAFYPSALTALLEDRKASASD